MKKNRLLWIFVFVFELVFGNSCKDRLFDNPLDPEADKKAYEILATLPISGIVPLDLTFSGESLWVVDTFSRVLSLDYNSGMVIRELPVEKKVNGIAFDGNGLWLAVKGSPQIFKISMILGFVIQTLDFSKGDFGPMDFYQGKLYIADRLSNSIIVVNPVDGNIEKSIGSPGFSLDGIAFDGIYLWTIDAPQMRIYKLTADGNPVIFYQTPAKAAAGLSYNSGIMWSGDQSGKIFKLRFQ